MVLIGQEGISIIILYNLILKSKINGEYCVIALKILKFKLYPIEWYLNNI